MKRIQLFEFEDYQWLPKLIRSGMTNLIMVFHKMMGTADVLSELIQNIRKEKEFNQIIDVGAGSGGAMIETAAKLNKNRSEPLKLILTDKYPNPSVYNKINESNTPNVSYRAESLDVKEIHTAPKGLKTMIASFHHMPPAVAKAIFKSAEKSGEPFLVYEIAKNNIPLVVWWLFLPLSLSILILMSLFMTPFVKPQLYLNSSSLI